MPGSRVTSPTRPTRPTRPTIDHLAQVRYQLCLERRLVGLQDHGATVATDVTKMYEKNQRYQETDRETRVRETRDRIKPKT